MSLEDILETIIPDKQERTCLIETLRNRKERITRSNKVNIILNGKGDGKTALKWLIKETLDGKYHPDTSDVIIDNLTITCVVDITDKGKTISPKAVTSHVINCTWSTLRRPITTSNGKRSCIPVSLHRGHILQLHDMIAGKLEHV